VTLLGTLVAMLEPTGTWHPDPEPRPRATSCSFWLLRGPHGVLRRARFRGMAAAAAGASGAAAAESLGGGPSLDELAVLADQPRRLPPLRLGRAPGAAAGVGSRSGASVAPSSRTSSAGGSGSSLSSWRSRSSSWSSPSPRARWICSSARRAASSSVVPSGDVEQGSQRQGRPQRRELAEQGPPARRPGRAATGHPPNRHPPRRPESRVPTVGPAAARAAGGLAARPLPGRAEAERAFQLAERLGSINAAAEQLGTTWPSLRKAFTRHGLGMPARNP
jgi:hypothetical protein